MANKFWVGGSGSWSDTAHWSLTTGGAGSAGVPGTGDAVTIDAHASGLNGGTLTIDQHIIVQSLLWGTMTGTVNNSGNFNITCNSNSGFSGAGSGARTWTGGTGFIKMTFAGNVIVSMATITNLTNPTTALAGNTIIFETTPVSINGSSISLASTVVLGGLQVNMSGAHKGITAATGLANLGAISLSAGNSIVFNNNQTFTSLNGTGTASNPIGVGTSGGPITLTCSTSGVNALDWCVLRGQNFTLSGGATVVVTNGIDLGGNTGSGYSLTAPTGGGSSTVGVIGG